VIRSREPPADDQLGNCAGQCEPGVKALRQRRALRMMVATSASSERKLWTGNPFWMRLLAALRRIRPALLALPKQRHLDLRIKVCSFGQCRCKGYGKKG